MIQGGSNKQKNHVDFKSEFYFSTPIWVAQAPMFLKSMNKLTNKYIKICQLMNHGLLKKIEKDLLMK